MLETVGHSWPCTSPSPFLAQSGPCSPNCTSSLGHMSTHFQTSACRAGPCPRNSDSRAPRWLLPMSQLRLLPRSLEGGTLNRTLAKSQTLGLQATQGSWPPTPASQAACGTEFTEHLSVRGAERGGRGSGTPECREIMSSLSFLLRDGNKVTIESTNHTLRTGI